jgi:hypothetical protein
MAQWTFADNKGTGRIEDGKFKYDKPFIAFIKGIIRHIKALLREGK